YCPRCRRAIRFRAFALDGPSWLKEVASSLGRGEAAVLYCISCWLVPAVGDFIAVLDPPRDGSGIEQGTVGKVIEAEGQGPFGRRFLVEFTGKSDGQKVRHFFYAHQIQAAGVEFGSSIPLSLRLPRGGTSL
ncbi:MAG TPA: hypothetical protein VFL86_14035, partial [Burkholderiaceae bacterium]|nr:hypothetical protein [Burkholderiaceae bacterium]